MVEDSFECSWGSLWVLGNAFWSQKCSCHVSRVCSDVFWHYLDRFIVIVWNTIFLLFFWALQTSMHFPIHSPGALSLCKTIWMPFSPNSSLLSWIHNFRHWNLHGSWQRPSDPLLSFILRFESDTALHLLWQLHRKFITNVSIIIVPSMALTWKGVCTIGRPPRSPVNLWDTIESLCFYSWTHSPRPNHFVRLRSWSLGS